MASRTACVIVCGALVAASGYPRAQSAPPPAPARGVAPGQSAPELQRVLGRYCVTCHNDRLKTAGLALDQLDLARSAGRRDLGEGRAQAAHARDAAAGTPRPDKAHLRARRPPRSRPHSTRLPLRTQPGPRHRPPAEPHRVRERGSRSAGARHRRQSLLPADEPDQQGFDNVAGVLSVSPRLLENYLVGSGCRQSTGGRRSGDRHGRRTRSRFPPRWCRTIAPATIFRSGRAAASRFPISSRSTASTASRCCCRRQLYLYLIGMGEPHQIDIRLDGALIKRFTIGGEGKGADGARELCRQHAGRSGVGSLHAHGR